MRRHLQAFRRTRCGYPHTASDDGESFSVQTPLDIGGLAISMNIFNWDKMPSWLPTETGRAVLEALVLGDIFDRHFKYCQKMD